MKRQRRRLAFNKAGSRGENSSPFSRMDEVRARVNRVSTHLGILVFEERNEAKLLSLSLSLSAVKAITVTGLAAFTIRDAP